MALRILRSDIDGQTAHVSVQFQAVEIDPTTGALSEGQPETVGIDHQSLMRSFHGLEAATPVSIKAAIMLWLEAHHEHALKRKRAITAIAHEIRSLKNQTLFAEPVAPATLREHV